MKFYSFVILTLATVDAVKLEKMPSDHNLSLAQDDPKFLAQVKEHAMNFKKQREMHLAQTRQKARDAVKAQYTQDMEMAENPAVTQARNRGKR